MTIARDPGETLAALTFRLADTEAALDVAATARDVGLRRIATRDVRIGELERLLGRCRDENVDLHAEIADLRARLADLERAAVELAPDDEAVDIRVHRTTRGGRLAHAVEVLPVKPLEPCDCPACREDAPRG